MLAASAAAWYWFARDPQLRTPYWGAIRTAITATIAIVVTLMVADAVLARRGGADRVAKRHLSGLVLAVIAWLLGGLFTLFDAVVQNDKRSGTFTGCSFAALNRPDPALESLAGLLALSATPMLIVLLVAVRRSRVAAWLSPALILGIYLLAVHLYEPHGVRTLCGG